MKRRPLALPALFLAASASAQAPASTTSASTTAASTTTVQQPAENSASRPSSPPGDDRVAVIGALDKRLGTTAEFTLKPGERFTFGRLSGILRSCEKTQPFERKQSAAFLQIVESPRPTTRDATPKPRVAFSGWLFAESPSLNPMQHQVYDIWLKSCTMSFPDGPKPPTLAGPAKKSASKPRRPKPSAPKAPEAAPAPAAPAPEPAPDAPAPA